MSELAKKASVLYHSTHARAIFFQVLAVASIVSLLVYLMINMFTNLEQRGIPIGFDFLTDSSGFGIIQTLIPYTEASSHFRVFLVGITNTLVVAVVGVIATTILGFVVGVARLSDSWLMVRLTGLYIEIFRNIPVLLQILFWNAIFRSVLPAPKEPLQLGPGILLSIKSLTIPKLDPNMLFLVMVVVFVLVIIATRQVSKYARKRLDETGKTFPDILTNIGIFAFYGLVFVLLFPSMFAITYPEPSRFGYTGGSDIVIEFIILTFALAFYHATYIAEQVRGSILAVDKGQKEAARSIGLKSSEITRRIVLPQAMRSIIPPLINIHLNLVKNSSLATAIGYPDLVSIFTGTSLNQSGRALEIMFMTMAVYLTFSLTISAVMNRYNRRVKLIER